MTDDTYFEVHWRDRAGQRHGGLVVQLPQDDAVTPGQRVGELTRLARRLAGSGELRLRTGIHVHAPPGTTPVPLATYLWADGRLNGRRFERHLGRMLVGRSPSVFLLRTGVPVVGDDLVGREAQIESLLSEIALGSCHLRAPRRYGKTSLLYRVEERQPRAVFVDLCDVRSPHGFLHAVLRISMQDDSAAVALRGLPELAAWPSPDLGVQVHEQAQARLAERVGDDVLPLVERVLRALATADVVLLLDEFSLFLRSLLDDNAAWGRRLLQSLHAVRTTATPPLRCVLAGSAGLTGLIEFEGLHDCFDDVRPIDLPPICTADAAVLVEELLYGAHKGPLPEVVERIISLVGDPIPYFLHALVHCTVAEVGGRPAPNANDVDVAYRRRLLGPAGNVFFRDFLLRERAYPQELRAGASAILHALARAPEGIREPELRELLETGPQEPVEGHLDRLLACLEEDYDLVREGGLWRMRSKVLAERWCLGEPWLTGAR